jgi:hypothetical protein
VLISVADLGRPQCHSAAGRIRSTEKSNDIGNRNRDFPADSIMPQPTTIPRTPVYMSVGPNCSRPKLLKKRQAKFGIEATIYN